ncbi:LOW QUALITY PROTEIN: PIN2/TERF1-interacting telomerase inhibitor 1 [Gastrophryne carolinensis]
MAMLAEPRRKQKWSVDPRNSAWSKDDSKFGQKMLEKMGWSKGKGLGAKEQGSTEHVKVQVKNNTLGLGAAINYEDNWLAHQDDFNQLLAELNNCHGAAGSDTPADGGKKSFSLEEKSKSSKKRVHYMKFAKGKDLSCRSNTDLACIFGKREKSKKSSQEEGDVDSEESEEIESPSQTDEVESGNTVTSTLSVNEYFAKRMAELKKSRSKISEVVEQNTEADIADGTDSSSEEPKKKRKKKKHDKRDVDCTDEAELVEDTYAEDNSVHKTKKSKSKKREESIHPEYNDDAEKTEEQEEELAQGKKIKKKKKKSKRNHETSDASENQHDSYTLNEENYTEQPKKKKKKKQKSDD